MVLLNLAMRRNFCGAFLFGPIMTASNKKLTLKKQSA